MIRRNCLGALSGILVAPFTPINQLTKMSNAGISAAKAGKQLRVVMEKLQMMSKGIYIGAPGNCLKWDGKTLSVSGKPKSWEGE